MAKINVPFDNKNYLVDESSFATSANALKSHLSSVMNGTGATINFGGVPYNVDSAKLSAARNAFVSHLGTVAGSGYKVVVNGVEYGVDSAKMTSAVADLNAVLGGLQTGNEGGTSSNRIAILEEQIIQFDEYGEYSVEAPAPLIAGDDYVVVWDDVEYGCEAFEFNISDSAAGIAIGNFGEESLGNKNAPFSILYIQELSIYVIALVVVDAPTSHAVAIYKVN